MEITETSDTTSKLPAKRGVRGVAGGTILTVDPPTIEGAVASLHVSDGFEGNRDAGVREVISGVTK